MHQQHARDITLQTWLTALAFLSSGAARPACAVAASLPLACVTALLAAADELQLELELAYV
jgi:hypothetical protein